MDPDVLIKRFETQAHRALAIRENLMKTRNWPEEDARVAAFRKINGVLTTLQLAFFLISRTIYRKDWWERHDESRAGEKDVLTTINAFEMFLKVGMIQSIVACIESSFRAFVRAMDPAACNNGKDAFKSIYGWLLNQLHLQQYDSLLDLWRNIRNTTHNNGLFFPPNGANQTVNYGGNQYLFEVGKLVDVGTIELLSSLVSDLIDMLEAVVTTSPLVDLPTCPDDAATQQLANST